MQGSLWCGLVMAVSGLLAGYVVRGVEEYQRTSEWVGEARRLRESIAELTRINERFRAWAEAMRHGEGTRH